MVRWSTFQSAATLLAIGAISACAAEFSQPPVRDVSVAEAFRDREAAFEQLARAMTASCEAKHAQYEARQRCVFEEYVEWLHLRLAYDLSADDRDQQVPPLVRCERARTHSVCEHAPRRMAELQGSRPAAPVGHLLTQ